MGDLRMPRGVYEAVRAHGEERYPEECCGVLLGRKVAGGWRVEAAVRAGNAERARGGYRIAMEELIGAEREARGRGLEIAGFYHSHPDCVAEWSRRDLEEAHWPGCAYMITAVVEGRARESRGFVLCGRGEDEKRFEELEIEVIEE